MVHDQYLPQRSRRQDHRAHCQDPDHVGDHEGVAFWAAPVKMNAVMDVRLTPSSCGIRIYRVSQVALHEARGGGGRHDVFRDSSGCVPEKACRGGLVVIVSECWE